MSTPREFAFFAIGVTIGICLGLLLPVVFEVYHLRREINQRRDELKRLVEGE